MPRAPRSLAFWLWLLDGRAAGDDAGRAGQRARRGSGARTPRRPPSARRAARRRRATSCSGRYEEALATYLDLYIQSDGRPEYLRNIGRCQQKLKQYPRAIESFKDYLRRARHLGADERKEVQGFISEMEAEMKASGRHGRGARRPGPRRRRSSRRRRRPAPAPTARPPRLPRPPPGAGLHRATARAEPALAGARAATRAAGRRAAPPPNGPTLPPNSRRLQRRHVAVARSAGARARPARSRHSRAGGERRQPAHTSPLRVVGIVSLIAAGAAAVGGTLALLNARSTFDDASKNGCPGANSQDLLRQQGQRRRQRQHAVQDSLHRRRRAWASPGSR